MSNRKGTEPAGNCPGTQEFRVQASEGVTYRAFCWKVRFPCRSHNELSVESSMMPRGKSADYRGALR